VPLVNRGQDVTGRLDSATQAAVYRIRGQARQHFVIDGRSISHPGAATWAIYDEGSRAVASGRLEDPLAFSSTSDRDLLLVISGTGGSGADPVDFQFLVVETDGLPVLNRGVDVSGRLDPARGSVIYRFQGDAGERLVFDSRSVSRSGAA